MAADFEIRLTPEGRRFKKELEELTKLEVAVGIPEGLSYPDGTSVAEVAIYNELGTVHIPSRPFMRNSLNGNKDKITQYMQNAAKGIANGRSAEEILNKIGDFQEGLIIKEFGKSGYEPNDPKTIAKKHSSVPLVDTGTLMGSIHHVVRERGSD